MLYSLPGMPVVYVIGEDWTLRAAVRAELRERGIEALGMETSADASAALAAGQTPSAIVLDENSKAASDPAIQKLVGRIPSVVVASRTATVRLGSATKTLFRPVQICEVVTAVLELLKGKPV
jgi:ABC-type sugar transport system substrate-binding protein